MIQPTPKELEEFQVLFEEFKNFKPENPKTHVDTEIIKKIITPLPGDDPMRKTAEQLIRYNKYTTMCVKFAPFFWDRLFKETICVE